MERTPAWQRLAKSLPYPATGCQAITHAVTSSGERIGRITPTGDITVFPLPARFVASIAAGPDGNLWFTEGDRIGRLTPDGVLTEFPVPEGTYSSQTMTPEPWADSDQIIARPDANLW